ncbi:MAG: archease [archaeon]
MPYKFLSHTADIKFQVWGNTLSQVFSEVTKAISEIYGKGEKIEHRKKKKIVAEGKDKESLLYNFIDEIIFLFDAESFVVSKADVRVVGNKLRGFLFGDDTKNYNGLEHIKAPTYAEMFIEKKGKDWKIQAVVDV